MQHLTHDSNGAHEFAGFSFDIFQVEAEGVVWRGAAPTFAEASRRVEELALASPADYIVWNRKTGDKQTIKSGTRQEDTGRNGAHS